MKFERAIAALMGLGALAGPAVAQDLQALKVAFLFPQSHWLWEQGGGIFVKKVEELTGGKVGFTPFPAGQLGKQTATVVSSGLAEFGIAVPSYEPDKLPLTSVGELPGMHGSACEGTAKLWELSKEGGLLYEKELKPLGLRALYVDILPPYRLFTTEKPINTLEDVGGLKVRANGAAMGKTARALDSAAVSIPSTEIYDALTRGTVDGALYPTFSVISDSLNKALNYGVRGPKLGGGSTLFVIKESVWEGLDPEIQAAMTQAGLETQQELCSFLDKGDAEAADKLAADGDVTFVDLSPEEVARWNDAVAAVADEWVSDMATAGYDGKELVDAFRAAPGTF